MNHNGESLTTAWVGTATSAWDVDFKLLREQHRDQILQCLSSNAGLLTRRCPIGRCLLGHDKLQKMEISSRQRLVGQAVNVEEELLFESLLTWCTDAETATASELIDVLEMASCSQGVLSEVQTVLSLHKARLARVHVHRRTYHSPYHTTPPMAVPGTNPMQPPMDVMSQLQRLTAEVSEIRSSVAAVKAQSIRLEAEMREVRSLTKPPARQTTYNHSVATSMPGEKAWCHAVHLKGKVVIAGGFNNINQPCKRVFVLHTLSGEWYEMESTPHALCSVAADPDSCKMFVVGGCSASGGEAVDMVFALNFELQQKEFLPKLILPCCRAASTVHRGCLYVLGGETSWYKNEYRYGGNGPYNLQILDLQHKGWTRGPELNRENPWLDCYKFVALGSLLICDRRHVFDTEKMAWLDEDLPHRPSGFSTAMSVVEDRLLVFGGAHDIGHIHELSENLQGWIQVGEMMTARRHATACTVGKSVYVVGGQSGNIFFDTVECFSLV